MTQRETTMVARCPSAAGQGTAGVRTPSTPPPSQRRPAPSPIQRPCHPSAPAPKLCCPSISAASHPKQRKGAPLPRASPAPANQQAGQASFSLPHERAPAATARPIPGLGRRGRPPRSITPSAPSAWTAAAACPIPGIGRHGRQPRRITPSVPAAWTPAASGGACPAVEKANG